MQSSSSQNKQSSSSQKKQRVKSKKTRNKNKKLKKKQKRSIQRQKNAEAKKAAISPPQNINHPPSASNVANSSLPHDQTNDVDATKPMLNSSDAVRYNDSNGSNVKSLSPHPEIHAIDSPNLPNTAISKFETKTYKNKEQNHSSMPSPVLLKLNLMDCDADNDIDIDLNYNNNHASFKTLQNQENKANDNAKQSNNETRISLTENAMHVNTSNPAKSSPQPSSVSNTTNSSPLHGEINDLDNDATMSSSAIVVNNKNNNNNNNNNKNGVNTKSLSNIAKSTINCTTSRFPKENTSSTPCTISPQSVNHPPSASNVANPSLPHDETNDVDATKPMSNSSDAIRYNDNNGSNAKSLSPHLEIHANDSPNLPTTAISKFETKTYKNKEQNHSSMPSLNSSSSPVFSKLNCMDCDADNDIDIDLNYNNNHASFKSLQNQENKANDNAKQTNNETTISLTENAMHVNTSNPAKSLPQPSSVSNTANSTPLHGEINDFDNDATMSSSAIVVNNKNNNNNNGVNAKPSSNIARSTINCTTSRFETKIDKNHSSTPSLNATNYPLLNSSSPCSQRVEINDDEPNATISRFHSENEQNTQQKVLCIPCKDGALNSMNFNEDNDVETSQNSVNNATFDLQTMSITPIPTLLAKNTTDTNNEISSPLPQHLIIDNVNDINETITDSYIENDTNQLMQNKSRQKHVSLSLANISTNIESEEDSDIDYRMDATEYKENLGNGHISMLSNAKHQRYQIANNNNNNNNHPIIDHVVIMEIDQLENNKDVDMDQDSSSEMNGNNNENVNTESSSLLVPSRNGNKKCKASCKQKKINNEEERGNNFMLIVHGNKEYCFEGEVFMRFLTLFMYFLLFLLSMNPAFASSNDVVNMLLNEPFNDSINLLANNNGEHNDIVDEHKEEEKEDNVVVDENLINNNFCSPDLSPDLSPPSPSDPSSLSASSSPSPSDPSSQSSEEAKFKYKIRKRKRIRQIHKHGLKLKSKFKHKIRRQIHKHELKLKSKLKPRIKRQIYEYKLKLKSKLKHKKRKRRPIQIHQHLEPKKKKRKLNANYDSDGGQSQKCNQFITNHDSDGGFCYNNNYQYCNSYDDWLHTNNNQQFSINNINYDHYQYYNKYYSWYWYWYWYYNDNNNWFWNGGNDKYLKNNNRFIKFRKNRNDYKHRKNKFVNGHVHHNRLSSNDYNNYNNNHHRIHRKNNDQNKRYYHHEKSEQLPSINHNYNRLSSNDYNNNNNNHSNNNDDKTSSKSAPNRNHFHQKNIGQDDKYEQLSSNNHNHNRLPSNDYNNNYHSNNNNNNNHDGKSSSKSARKRRKRQVSIKVFEYYNNNQDAKNENIFNLFMSGALKNEKNKFNFLDKSDKIGILYVEEYYLNQIFIGKKQLEIRSKNIIKWKNKWVGVTSKLGEIHGQILITDSKQYKDRNDLLTDDMIQNKHCIENEDDQESYIKDGSWAWKITAYTKYPSPLKYLSKSRSPWNNAKRDSLSLQFPNEVYIDNNHNYNCQFTIDSDVSESECVSYPSPSPSPSPSSSLSLSLTSPPTESEFKSNLWQQNPIEIQNTFTLDGKLSDRGKHRQILDYEELDELIYKLIEAHNQDEINENNFENVYSVLFTTIECIHLVPKTKDAFNVNKFEWIPPNNQRSKCYVYTQKSPHESLKSIIEKWLFYSPKTTFSCSQNEIDYNKLLKRLHQEYTRHCNLKEYIGPTLPFTKEALEWLRKKCKGCWGQEAYDALHAPIRCCVCAEKENSHCTHCIIAAGKNHNVPICPECANSYYRIDSIPIQSVPQLKELKIAQILETTEDVLIQFIPEQTDTLLYCKSVLVEDRFAVFTRQNLISVLSQEKFDNLVKEFINRPKNVVFEEYKINLQKGLNEYIQARGEDKFYGKYIKDECNWGFNQGEFNVKISSIGPLKYDGHVIAPRIRDCIIDKGDYEAKAIEEYEAMFPDDVTFDKNELAKRFCHAVLLKNGEVAILGLEEAYKGKGNCWKFLTYNEETKNFVLNNNYDYLIKDDKENGYYWTIQEIDNLSDFNWENLKKIKRKGDQTKYRLSQLVKQPLLKVVKSGDKLKKYLLQKHPNLMLSMEQYELLSNILSYTIATQIPQLKPVFYQHIKYNNKLECRYPHGSWYGNKDFIKYWPKYKVNAHIDHQDLVQPGDYHFGPYVVFKLGAGGSDQMLCSVSNKSSGCEFDRSKPKGDRDHGGHVLLPPGTVYWMFDEGACGGISHSIHNAEMDHHLWSKELFGGFKSKSYTLVMRPFLIKDETIFDIRQENS